MTDFVERIVMRLRTGRSLSRNRHFRTFSSPEGRRALRIHRHLRSIETDLCAGAVPAVEREPERVCLTLKGKGRTRVAYLTLDEFRILCTNPIVRAALGDAAVDA
jgi:hypothetical protein